jgi:uncharacterized protein YwqG
MKRLFDRLLRAFRREPTVPADEKDSSPSSSAADTGDNARPDLAAIAAALSRPALQLVRAESFARSHFGGTPDLPFDIEWPQWKGRPLSFLARLSMPEIQAALEIDWLPLEGALLFFYDLEEHPWGYDPADRGGAVVLYVPEPADVDYTVPAQLADLELQTFPRRAIAFRRIDVLPSWQHPEVESLALDGDEFDAWLARSTAPFGGAPMHQVDGYPAPVQGDDMEFVCQLASHGVRIGDPAVRADPQTSALAQGASQWRLLFQFDSDEDLGVSWGDAGCIYYWVKQEEAREGNFSSSWLVLQCH